ncbi:MAG: hypothetical protein KAS32_19515 [Candidatus Peribacteraceae bacterium]|nr:hypothetical protein [Candidatus Peribacteraceae bacterium]
MKKRIFITEEAYKREFLSKSFEMINKKLLEEVQAYTQTNRPIKIPDIGSNWISRINPDSSVTVTGIDLSIKVAYVKTFTSQRYNIKFGLDEYAISFSDLLSNYNRSPMVF